MKGKDIYYFPQTAAAKEIHRKTDKLIIAVTLIFFLLLVRSWYLQIVKGKYYETLSENNRIRTVSINPPRGLIYDRKGNLIVDNAPVFNLYLMIDEMEDMEKTIENLSRLIDLSKDDLRKTIMGRKNSIYPVKIKGSLTLKEVAQVESNRREITEVFIQAELQRNYIFGKDGAHFLGYVGEISPAQAEQKDFSDVLPGQIVGQYGIERSYDKIIRGTNGEKRIEVNAHGEEMGVIEMISPIQGRNIYLTIDADLQKVAEEALGEDSGAIVAMDPNNGEILAAVSHPEFDPNVLTRGVSSSEWQSLMSAPGHPFMNRIIQGQYPPGSTFKIVVATAALETGKIDAEGKMFCKGSFPFGNRVFRDWKKTGHGTTDMYSAIVESCDVYFYEMGRRLGVDDIAKYGAQYGLGEKTGIELNAEKSGTLPSTKWKKKVFDEPWYPGETISVAIGQGYVTVTPIQMVSLTGAAATGKRYKPHLVKGYMDESGQRKEVVPVLINEIEAGEETFKVIRKGLEGVVHDSRGTGGKARSKLARIAGKTGTAQVVAMKRELAKTKEIPKEFQDHAWFVAYAPAEDPQIAVVVLVEHGGHGGSASAPLAKRVIEAYLKHD